MGIARAARTACNNPPSSALFFFEHAGRARTSSGSSSEVSQSMHLMLRAPPTSWSMVTLSTILAPCSFLKFLRAACCTGISSSSRSLRPCAQTTRNTSFSHEPTSTGQKLQRAARGARAHRAQQAALRPHERPRRVAHGESSPHIQYRAVTRGYR
eukprot:3596287-Prymnesium_polylepis.2